LRLTEMPQDKVWWWERSSVRWSGGSQNPNTHSAYLPNMSQTRWPKLNASFSQTVGQYQHWYLEQLTQ